MHSDVIKLIQSNSRKTLLQQSPKIKQLIPSSSFSIRCCLANKKCYSNKFFTHIHPLTKFSKLKINNERTSVVFQDDAQKLTGQKMQQHTTKHMSFCVFSFNIFWLITFKICITTLFGSSTVTTLSGVMPNCSFNRLKIYFWSNLFIFSKLWHVTCNQQITKVSPFIMSH